MFTDDIQDIIADCQGLTREEILALYAIEYFETDGEAVRAAFELLGFEEHELTNWIIRHIK